MLKAMAEDTQKLIKLFEIPDDKPYDIDKLLDSNELLRIGQ